MIRITAIVANQNIPNEFVKVKISFFYFRMVVGMLYYEIHMQANGYRYSYIVCVYNVYRGNTQTYSFFYGISQTITALHYSNWKKKGKLLRIKIYSTPYCRIDKNGYNPVNGRSVLDGRNYSFLGYPAF